MIFRKPYAFFIKYFKLFHLIMTIITAYVLYKATFIFSFISEYISTNENVIGRALIEQYFNNFIFIGIFITIIMAIIVLVVMKFKKKPITFYIFNLFVYTFTFIVFIFGKNIINNMQMEIVDIRLVKLVQDLFTATIILQFISISLTLVRAIGFDVKKFDFVKDLQNLNIDEKDNEEFEVDVEFNTDNLKTTLKRKIRHAKYVYIENKFIIHILLVIIVIIGIFQVNSLIKDNDKIYKQNSYFSVDGFTMSINNSYYTKYSFNNQKISNNYTYVILDLNVKNLSSIPKKLEQARMELIIDDNIFYPTTKYTKELQDFGVAYENYDVTEDLDNYVLIYEVPNHLINKKMYYRYASDYQNNYKVKLENIDLDKKEIISKKINEEVKINEGIFNGLQLKLINYQINDSFNINYKFCISDSECYDSVDYIRPIFDHNYNETIIKLEVDSKLNENYNNDNLTKISDILSNLATIKYKINNQSDYKYTQLQFNTKYNKEYYLEINSEVNDAIEIILQINLRNKIIEYKLK